MERLVVDDPNASLTMEHLECFAKDGLRTLCLGYRVLTNEEYNVNVNRWKLLLTMICLFIFAGMVSAVSRSINSD